MDERTAQDPDHSSDGIEVFHAGPPGARVTITNAPCWGVRPDDPSTHIEGVRVPEEELALDSERTIRADLGDVGDA